LCGVSSLSLQGVAPLKEHDPEMYALIKEEEHRQRHCIELIASEVRPRAVATCRVNGWCP
jgi:glycine/serine hydroxymethyltransferase